jgi:hypothetical protein
MTEPRRLLEQDATDAERALLHSAHADGPPVGADQRMLIALEGLTAGSAPGSGHELGGSTSTAPLAAQSTKLGALAKIGLAALIGAGAVGGGALVHRLVSPRVAPDATSAASAPATQEAPALGTAVSPGATERPLLAAASAPNPPAPAESGTVLRQQPTNAWDDSLSAELRLLDAARAAVDARNPAAAQRSLDSYAQRFPQGRLKPEAAVLRLAVLVRQGDRAAARSLATRLLASETYKAYEPRIRSLLREAQE